LSNLSWDYLDQLISATNGTFTSYYNYDNAGSRTRKVVIKGNVREERYYINGYEVYRKYTNNTLDYERKTLNISDDEKVFVRTETKTGENEVVRYQYDNHLGSACLELENTGQIISYEEYHPFGTTSYRSGRNETEVSLKRYKYCGKERDEETGLYYYGMRYYAAWLCRFVSVDPLQFKYPYYTPYQYAGNKPITFIDLDGGEEKKQDEKKKTTTTTDAGHGAGKKGGIIDPGAVDGKNYEKDYALTIEEQINIWLTKFGVDNMRTREGEILHNVKFTKV
jgi:RHS repeat-associated protein